METLNGRFVAVQIQGGRDYQEDDFGLLEMASDDESYEHIVFVLADGMGGHVGGAEASHIITDAFLAHYEQAEGDCKERLEASLHAANGALAREIEIKPELDGMGSTFVAVSIENQSLQWVSVGDSPLWLFRAGHLKRLNEDHSMVPVLNDMVDAGRLSADDASKDRRRNALRSVLMGNEIPIIDIADSPINVDAEDIVVLASDGVETLSDEAIAVLLADQKNETLKQKVDAIIDAVVGENKKNQDNTTVLLMRPLMGSSAVDGESKAAELQTSGSGIFAAPKQFFGQLFKK